MKRTILIVFAIFLSASSFAQTQLSPSDTSKAGYGQPKTVKYFGEIVYTYLSSPSERSIKIDLGNNSFLGKRYPSFKDKNGKTIHFSTIIDALNFMSSLGWTLELVYDDEFIDEGSSYGSIKHFVISKTLTLD